MVVPALCEKATKFSIRQLTYDEGLEVLRGQCMTPRDEKWIAPWLVSRDVDEREVDGTLARLAQRTTILQVEFGFDDIRKGANELVKSLHDAFQRARVEHSDFRPSNSCSPSEADVGS